MKYILILWTILATLPMSANETTPFSPWRGGGDEASEGVGGENLEVSFSSHFCRLLVSDGESLMPLSAHASRVVHPTDSLTSEQIFVEFLLRDNNWQSLRFFPHIQDNGTVVWYAPADDLPASLDAEHQKYIREVFPRLIAEIHAGNWQTVEAYIDRMIEYQCQFGGIEQSMPPSSRTVTILFFLISLVIILCNTKFVSNLLTL